MRICILNHCSHNKGDNSVLYYLLECIKLVSLDKVDLSICCSDGKKPFWMNSVSYIHFWPGGRLFKSPDASFLTNSIARIRFLFMRKLVYKVFLWFYAYDYVSVSKFIAFLFFDKKMLTSIKMAEVVFCTGGHHISNVLEKNCINPQLISLAIAVLYNKKLILWSQSIGPLNGCPGYAMRGISKIFNACNQIFVRDELSVRCIESLSEAVPTMSPDSVFFSSKLFYKNKNETNYVACAVYTAGINDQSYMENYRDSWIKLCDLLVLKGLSVVFVPMQYKGYGGDERNFLKSVVEKCNSEKVKYIDEDFDPKTTLQIFNGASYVIGHKTHSIIYGLALSKPTIAIAYHEKSKFFMSMFGLDNFVFSDVIGNELLISDMIDIRTALFQQNMYSEINKSEQLSNELIKNMERSLGH